MSKKRKGKSYTGSRTQRDYQYNSRRRLLRSPFRSDLSVDDRRRFHPYEENYNLDGRLATRTIRKRDTTRRVAQRYHYRLEFKSPRNVTVCNRRNRRRETLFAQNRVGKGKSVSKERRMSPDSDIVCRRR